VWVPIFEGQTSPDAGKIRVERHGERNEQWDGENRAPAARILFNALIVQDGIPGEAAHAAFLEIDEYRSRNLTRCTWDSD
jgi:hypothetical protein